jgi:Protein of unknown function (DUF3570)
LQLNGLQGIAFALVLAASSLTAGAVRAGDDQDEKNTDDKATGEHRPERKLEDTSNKHASLEIAGYNDSDHVTVFTPSISADIQNVTAGASIRGSYLVDVVSAASVDIVSTASRRWSEVRQAGSLGVTYKPHDFGVDLGGSLSSEPDYLSYGLAVTVIHDFDERNLTAQFGYGYSHDISGRHGTPFSVFSREINRGSFNGGLSIVIDRATLLGFSGDVVIENGDQSKPYRYIPMFAPDVASSVPKGASIDFVTANRLPERPLEQLPLSRHRFALTTRYAHRYDESTLRLEERLYDDSWGLFASTTDAKWIVDLGRRFAVWPHLRFHDQGEVSFWQRAYISGPAPGWDLPEYRTGDRELGPLWSFTAGGGVKVYIGSEKDPHAWGIALHGDVMYTSFLDDLYLLNRTGIFGAVTLETEL